MSRSIEALFPRLASSPIAVTSEASRRYNCFAWAAGDATRWWQPGRLPFTFWPAGAPRVNTLEAFEAAFATLGYSRCEGADLDAGLEKIAIYGDEAGHPTHAARQLPDGSWTSKLGTLEDIRHDLAQIEGGETEYGSVVLILSRQRAT